MRVLECEIKLILEHKEFLQEALIASVFLLLFLLLPFQLLLLSRSRSLDQPSLDQRLQPTGSGLLEVLLVTPVLLHVRLDLDPVVLEVGERGLQLVQVVLCPVEHLQVQAHVRQRQHLLVDERVGVDRPVPARRDDGEALGLGPTALAARPQRDAVLGVDQAVVPLLSSARHVAERQSVFSEKN